MNANSLYSWKLLRNLLPWGVLLSLLGPLSPELVFAAGFTARSIANSGGINVMEVDGEYAASNLDGSTNSSPREIIAKEFYKTHPDQYDFLLFFTNFDFPMPDDAVAYYVGVKNDVSGIGLDLLDNSALFGSNSVLQGTIDMGNLANLKTDPLTPDFSNTMGTLSHELMHRWGAYVHFRSADGSVSSDLLGKDGTHWSFLLDTKGSLGYGNSWQNNGNGTFTSFPGRKYFSPLDLYLMGFLDKSAVPPMLLLSNPDVDPKQLSQAGVTIGGSAGSVTIDQIIAAEGERNPDVRASQKSFRIGCVFLTRPGTYNPDNLSEIRTILNQWPVWFSSLTNGLARITVDAVLDHAPATNPGFTPGTVDPRTIPPEINDGVAWLIDHQQPDGRWQDDPATIERDSSTALLALRNFPEAGSAREVGLAYLASSPDRNQDYRARKLGAMFAETGTSATRIAELIGQQNRLDGGWGGQSSYLSNALDTSLVLKALSETGYRDISVLNSAVQYLKNHRQTSGGWGQDASESDLLTTANVVAAYTSWRDDFSLEEQISSGCEWLRGRQHPDGGFGDIQSSVSDTAIALMALKAAGESGGVVSSAAAYLLSSQAGNGSWNDTVNDTALAVTALWTVLREPDLVVGAADISFSPGSVIALPAQVTVSALIVNRGLLDVPEVKISMFLGGLAPANKQGEAVVALNGVSSTRIDFPVEISEGEPQQVFIVVDPEQLIGESDESNNVALKALYSEPGYDFVVKTEALSVTPGVVNPHEPFVVSVTLGNHGTRDGFNVPVSFSLSGQSEVLALGTIGFDLPVGQAVTRELSWSAVKQGAFQLVATIDPQDVTREIDESNNSAAVPLVVNQVTEANLVVRYDEISASPSPLQAGHEAAVSVLLRNNGFSDADGVDIALSYAQPGKPEVVLDSRHVAFLASGAELPLTFTWPNVPELGEVLLVVRVDPSLQVPEFNEDDNVAFVAREIAARADLYISEESITFEPAVPKSGDQVKVSIKVHNLGEQTVYNLSLALSPAGQEAVNLLIPEVVPGGEATSALIFDLTGKTGSIAFRATVDPAGEVDERDERNNSASRTMSIQDAGLWLSEHYISPNGDGIKDSTDFGFRLTAPEDVRLEIVDASGLVVRSFSGARFHQSVGDALTWDGRDDRGVVVGDGGYRFHLVNGAGKNLADLPVEVDNNRSPLADAIGTPYLAQNNLTCELPNRLESWSADNYQWSALEEGLVINIASGSQDYPAGPYWVNTDGDDPEGLIPSEWSYSDAASYSYARKGGVSPNADKIVIEVEKGSNLPPFTTQHELWTIDLTSGMKVLLDSDEEDAQHLMFTDDASWIPPLNDYIAYSVWNYSSDSGRYELRLAPCDGSAPPTTAFTSPEYFDYEIAPDGKSIAVWTQQYLYLVDVYGNVVNSVPLVTDSLVRVDWLGNDHVLCLSQERYYSNGVLMLVSLAAGIVRSWDEVSLYNDRKYGGDVGGGWVRRNSLQVESLPGAERFVFTNLDNSTYRVSSCASSGECEAIFESPLPLTVHVGKDGVGAMIIEDERNLIRCEADGSCRNVFSASAGILEEGGWSPDYERFVLLNSQVAEAPEPDYQQWRMKFRCAELFANYSNNLLAFDLKSGGIDTFPDIFSSYNVHFCEDPEPRDVLSLVSRQWLGNDLLLFEDIDQGVLHLNLQNGFRGRLFEANEARNLRVSPFGRYLTFDRDVTSSISCPLGTEDLWAAFSLLNLTADLKVVKNSSAFILSGTVADLNFDRYVLEYADTVRPGDWQLLKPSSSNPVVEGVIASWVPPHEGNFRIRLTATDKAGNLATDIQRVSWGRHAKVTSLYLDDELISPNGDGVKDQTELHYKIKEPVHLEFRVVNDHAETVRTIYRDYLSVPGQNGEDSIIWDGRDEWGLIVPDGHYSINLFDYSFGVEVDLTPPVVAVDFGMIYSDEGYDYFFSDLLGLARDSNISGWTVEIGAGENPQEWTLYAEGSGELSEQDQAGNLTPKLVSLFRDRELVALVDKKFRLLAHDRAGNSSTALTDFLDEIFVARYWRPGQDPQIARGEGLSDYQVFPAQRLADGSFPNVSLSREDELKALWFLNTYRSPVQEVALEYLLGRSGSNWQSPENGVRPFEQSSFSLPLHSGYELSQIATVKAKMISQYGEVTYSNQVKFAEPPDSDPPGSGGAPSAGPSLKLTVDYPPAAECNSLSGQVVIYSLLEAPVAPRTISYSLETASGELLLATGAAILTINTLELDAAGQYKWGEGTYPLKAVVELDDANGTLLTATNVLIIDRTLPVSRLTSPAPDEEVCPAHNASGSFVDVYAVGNDQNRTNDSISYSRDRGESGWITAYKFACEWSPSTDCSLTGTSSNGIIGSWGVTHLASREYSLQIRSVDGAGNLSCNFSAFLLNGIDTLSAASNRQLFSPNGDGRFDEIEISYSISDDVRISSWVLDSAGRKVRTILNGYPFPGGTGVVDWDGRNDAGAPVVDGVYKVVVSAVDDCGNISSAEINEVEVDNTPPLAIISFPTPTATLGMMVEITGSATDRNFHSFQVEIIDPADSENPLSLRNGTFAIANKDLAVWNLYQQEGLRTIRLTVHDRAGNTSQTSMVVDLGQRLDLVTDFLGTPKIFSPLKGLLNVKYVLNENVIEPIDVKISVAQDGVIMRSMSANGSSNGQHSWLWDGLDDKGKAVPDGIYSLILHASLTGNPTAFQDETVTVQLDATLPRIDFETPLSGNFYSRPFILRGTVDDALFQDYQLTLTQAGSLLFEESGEVPRTAYIFKSFADIADGDYLLTVAAKDQAANESRQELAFTIDSLPPEVSLDAPTAGALFGGPEQKPVEVAGRVFDLNLADWELKYGSGVEPASWNVMASGNHSVDPSAILLTWQVGPEAGLTDGIYTFSLSGKDKAGLEKSAKAAVQIDNTPPIVQVSSPDAAGFITKPQDVAGTVKDANLLAYSVALAPALCGGADLWSPMKNGAIGVEDGVLAHWAKLPPDGSYCLQVVARDKVGLSTTLLLDVTIDTTPPAPPELSGRVDGLKVVLSWPVAPDQDVVGYNLYRDGKKLNQELLQGLSYDEAGLGEGSYEWQLTAVDAAGWESVKSAKVLLSVDQTPPLVKISQPTAESSVSGLAEIKGTAYSRDDFKEYRVYVGQGENPGSWELLRQSPLSTSNGKLAELDTLPLPEGSCTIKLEAEDLNGNVATVQVLVVTDNQAPVAPLLLSASVSSTSPTDVEVLWTENPEADLAGYLLYRNYELVNTVGAGTGSLKSFLLNATSYLDGGRDDGDYEYFLIAMDKAGNLSDQSNTFTVTIDTGTPQALIVEPLSGSRFTQGLAVKAESPDQDIATVQFQYQPAGSGVWSALGHAVEGPPFMTGFDPGGLGLGYGDFHLRAIATDRAGKTDPTPQLITVTFTDLSPPAAPLGLATKVAGAAIAFAWAPNPEADLAGYNLYCLINEEPFLVASSLPSPPYTLSAQLDGEYVYELTAVDSFGNESGLSVPVTAKVYTPYLEPPPAIVTAKSMTVTGFGVYPGDLVTFTVAAPDGVQHQVESVADSEGHYLATLPLAEGINQLTAQARDSEGNLSNTSTPLAVRCNLPPAAPTGLQAVVADTEVQLSWDENREADLAGYNLYRDGVRLNQAEISQGTYLDSQLLNDVYSYQVSALDLAGGESPLSMPALAKVTMELLPPPDHLGITAPPEGGSLTICWSEIAGAAGYILYRSASSGGEYRVVNDYPLPGACVTDTLLHNGTPYFYVITTLDVLGNESALSGEVTGIPADTLLPAPPLFVLPVESGGEVRSETATVAVAGLSEAGSQVELFRNGTPVGSVLSETVSSQLFFPETELDTDFWNVGVSPDGRRTIFPYEDANGVGIGVYELQSREYSAIPLTDAAEVYVDDWSPDSEKVVIEYADSDWNWGLAVHDFVSSETKSLVTNTGEVCDTLDGWSPDGNKIACEFYSEADNLMRVAVFDVRNGVAEVVSRDNEEYRFREWSPDGARVVFDYDDNADNQRLAVYDVLDKKLQQVPLPEEVAGWWLEGLSADRSLIAYGYEDNAGLRQVTVYDARTDTMVPAAPPGSTEAYFDEWSPVGRRFALGFFDGAGLRHNAIIDFATGMLSEIPSLDDGYFWEWSPDGSKILFEIYSETTDEWYDSLFDLTDGSLRPLASTPVSLNGVTWLPDSSGFVTSLYSAEEDAMLVYHKDLKSGEFVKTGIPFEAYWDFELSPDGRQILWNTNGILSIYDFSTNQVIQTPAGLNRIVAWSPNHQHLLLRDDSEPDNLWLASVDAPDNAVSLYNGWYQPDDLRWLADGRIVFLSGDNELVQLLPGSFLFPEVELQVGDNLFEAIAIDGSGNIGPFSEPISVYLDGAALPDLAVSSDDIYLYPQSPKEGEEAVITIEVRNPSPVTLRNVEVAVYLRTSDGAIRLLEALTIPEIAAGQSAWQDYARDSSGQAGVNSIVVQLDGQNRIGEADEGNNLAVREFLVSGAVGLELQATLNRELFPADDVLNLDLTIANSGPASSVRIESTIEDAAGYPVTLLPVIARTLTYGGVDNELLAWPVGHTYAGEYRLRVVMKDAAWTVLAERLLPFTILPDLNLRTTMRSDARHYSPGQEARLGMRIDNQGVNLNLAELEARLTITSELGEVYAESRQLPNLLSGTSAEFAVTWPVGLSAPGNYTATVTVWSQGQTVSAASLDFVVDSQFQLTGLLRVEPKVVVFGSPVGISCGLNSSGNIAAGRQELSVLLLDNLNQAVLAQSDLVAELDANEGWSGSVAFAAELLHPGNFRVLFYRHNGANPVLLAEQNFSVADFTAPSVRVVSPLADAVLNRDPELSVAVSDNSGGVGSVEYRVDQGSWRPLPLVDPATGRYAGHLNVGEGDEGAHLLAFRATDLAGNSSVPVTVAIILQPLVEMAVSVLPAQPRLGEELTGTLTIVNHGWSKFTTLQAWIEDAGGTPVHPFPDQALQLQAEESRPVTLTWNVTTSPAGSYRLSGRLLRSGTVAVEGSADFAIQPTVVLTGTIQPDRSSYGLDAPVQLAATIASSSNFTIPLLTAQVVIADQAGLPVQTSEEMVTDLAAGPGRTLDFAWNTGHLPAGPYTATLNILVEERSEAAAVGELLIEAAPLVTGTVTPAHSDLPQGENLRVATTINNVGNQPLAALPVRLLLTDATGTVLSTASWSSELAIDAASERSEELATRGLYPGRYRLRLECDLQGQAVVLAETALVVTDVTPPLLTVLSPLNGSSFSEPFELAIQVEDEGSGVAAVEYRLDGNSWLPLPAKATTGLYGLTWTPVATESGDHLLFFRAGDKAGNSASSPPVAISIALCNPFADLTGTLDYQPHPLYQGREIIFPYELVNGCPGALPGLTVTLQISDPSTGTLLYAQNVTADLAAQGSQSGEFRLAAPGLAAGDALAALRVSASGQTERELAVVRLEVLPDLRISAEVKDRSHLLVWLNSGCEESGGGSAHSDQDEGHYHQDDCLNHDLLEQALSGAVDYYYLAGKRAEFEAQLRNPLVTDILIIGDHQPLTGHYSEELREKVNSGAGLIASGWLPPADLGLGSPSERALLGVVGSGSFGRDERLRLLTIDSPVTSAGILPSGSGLLKVAAAADTTVAGWLAADDPEDERDDEAEGHEVRWGDDLTTRLPAPPQSVWSAAAAAHDDDDGSAAPAIVLHDYGQGRTIYYAFDYSRALTPEDLTPLAVLLGDSLRHVHRDMAAGLNLAPLGVAPLQWAVTNQGAGQLFGLQSALPPGLRLFNYQNEAWQLGGTWRSDLAVAAGESGALSFSILAPEKAGALALELAASAEPGPGETTGTLWSESFSFSVPSDREALLSAARTALTNLQVSKPDATRVKTIKAYLEKVRGRAILRDRDLELNIQELRKAIGALLFINSLEVPAIRLRLDELLRIEESRWYFHTGNGGNDDDDDDEHRSDTHGAEGVAR